MKVSDIPEDEEKRLEALLQHHILDTEAEPDYDDIVHLAAQLIGTPIAIITLLDEKRQWFKAELGLGIKETHRNLSFCAHAIHLDDVMIVNDALEDVRFFDNPLVTGDPHIRFYAGIPITGSMGYKLGTLAVIDVVPRELDQTQKGNLRILARQVSNLLQLRRAVQSLKKTNNEIASLVKEKTQEFKDAFERLTDAFVALDNNWCFTYLNSKANQILGKESGYLLGKHIWIELPDNFSAAFREMAELAMHQQQPQRLEEYYPSQDLWFEIHIYPSHKGVSFYFNEITKRKKVEDEILRVNERAAIITRATNDIVWDWNILTDEVVWNDNYYSYLGYDPETTPSDTESWYNLIHPEDRERVAASVQKVIEAKSNYWSNEYRIFKSDQSIIHVFDRGFVIYNEDGQPSRMIGAIMDITILKNHEAKITHEKKLSDSIINSMPGIFYLFDENGKFIRWNENFQTISGYGAEEVSQMHPLDFFHESQKELLKQRIGEALTKGFAEVEAFFYTKDGRKIPYYFNGWRVEYENKICLNGMGIDITDRRKAEAALFKNWESYKNLFESNPLPMWIYELNTLAFVKVNRAAVVKYGYEEEEFANMTILEIRPEEEIAKLKKSIDPGSPLLSSSSGWKHKTKSGKILEVDIYSHAILFDGKNCRLIVANDVTEKKKAEEQYRVIFENTLEGIYQSSPDGKLLKANPALAKMYGYDSPEDMVTSVNHIGNDLYANPEDRVEMKKLLMIDGKAYGVELLALKKDKSTFWVRNNMRIVYDDKGNVDYYEGTLEDITERKEDQEKLREKNVELRKTNHELDRFVYSVSHDLRAPLASILGLVNVAEMEKPPASFLTYLIMIRESVDRLEEFIKDILNYSRNSRLKINLQKIDWKTLIDEVKMNMNQMNGAGRLKINLVYDDTTDFYSDPTRIKILINNLLSNSIKYQDIRKEALIVDISVRTASTQSVITYSDNGIGIESDRLDKIFDMFYRGNEDVKGSGLGLYIAKETVLKLNGTIKVWSTRGKSTTFKIEIPNGHQVEMSRLNKFRPTP